MSARRENQSTDRNSEIARPRKRRTFLLVLLVAIGLALFFLPTILVNTPLKQTAIEYATKDIKGEVSIDKISAGWFSPIKIGNVVLKGESGAEILSAESIETSNTLFGFATGSDYGKITITRPTIELQLRADGSNLEDALANYLEPAETESSSSGGGSSTEIPKVSVEITEGLVRMTSDTLSQPGIIENLNAAIECMGDEAPLTAKIKMKCSAADEQGAVVADVIVDSGQQQLTVSSLAAQFNTQQLPIAAFAPALTRVLGPVNCAGKIDAAGIANVNLADSSIALNVDSLNATQVAFVAPDLIGSDQFAARSITATGELQANSNQIYAKQFRAESEFARMTANGQFDVEQLMQLAAGNEIPQTGFQLDAAVDLAQVTQMMPETTHMRDGVKMNSGVLQITANTRNEANTQRMIVNVEAANINFEVDGQNIVWNQPLRFVGVAGTKNQQLMLEDFQLQSEFLTATGFAGFDRGRLKVDGDLNKMIEQANQILDLGGLQLAGQLGGEMSWQLASGIDSFQAGADLPVGMQGRFKIENPVLQFPGLNRWQEAQIDLAFSGNAITNTTGKVAFQSGAFEMQMGNETATGELVEPINDLWNASKYQFQCTANGSIGKWLAQARNFAELPEFACDGNMASEFLVTINANTARLNQIKLDSTDFAFNGFSLDIREPKLSVRGHMKYHFADGTLQFVKTRLATASMSADTEDLVVDMSRKILADGTLTFRANANRVSQWIGLSMPGDSIRWDGQATGSFALSSAQDLFGGDLQVNVADMVFVQPAAVVSSGGIQQAGNQTKYSEVWREPEVRVASKIALTDDFDNLIIQGLNVDSKMADIQANGGINQLSSTMAADLTGRWNVDWSNVNQLVTEMAGDVVTFTGSGWQPLEIKGPLYDANSQYAWIPNQLQAVAGIQWEQAEAFNLPLGTSNVNIRLNDSLATISSQGSQNIIDKFFQLQPVIDLRAAEPVLHLRQGTMLDNWEISEQDSRTWLKYAAPLIADATSAQGKVSANVSSAAVPLFDPFKASAQGALDVHNLTIGPGPLAQQIIPMIDQLLALVKPESNGIGEKSRWMQLPEQSLPFAVQQGRVHHQGFRMNYDDIVMETRGSVGFDQTMDLTLDIPILESWVGSNEFLRRLIGKKISIPIRGTLSKPQLDRRSISQLAQQMLRESAVGAVNDRVKSEVSQLQEKYGGKVQGELDRLQQDVNDKLKSGFEDKVQNELQNGLNRLFGGDKK